MLHCYILLAWDFNINLEIYGPVSWEFQYGRMEACHDAFTCIIKKNKMCYVFQKILFAHLQQYDENHCVYLVTAKNPKEMYVDHACAAYNY